MVSPLLCPSFSQHSVLSSLSIQVLPYQQAKEVSLFINYNDSTQRLPHQVKVPTTKFNNLSFIPRTHMVEGEMNSKKLSSYQNMYVVVHAHMW